MQLDSDGIEDDNYDVCEQDHHECHDNICSADAIQLKTRENIEDITTIKCKLRGLINDPINEQHLIDIIKARVIKTNKIVLEGTYLFYVYLLYILNKKKDDKANKETKEEDKENEYTSMKITCNTVRRCAHQLISDSCETRKTGNQIEDNLITFVRKNHFNFSLKNREKDFTNEKGMTNSVDTLCDTYFTNIKIHICMNFKKYQKRYLFCKLKKYAEKSNITEKNIKFLLYAIQQKVNGNVSYKYTKKENIEDYDKFAEKINLDKFITDENTLLKKNIPEQISNADELPSVSDDDIFYYLRYFHIMQKELTNNKVKCFPLIPHYVPKLRYVRFEARSLYSIYNSWRNTKIGVKDFEKNFRVYLFDMFTIEKKYKKVLKRYPIIRSITTDGYTISITFQKMNKIQYIPKDKTKKETIKVEKPKQPKKEKILYEFETEYDKQLNSNKQAMMFDATELKTNEEFLNKFNIGGADIGNRVMLDITMQNGLHISVHKNYYNDIAHVNRNKEILQKEIDRNKMNDVYALMSTSSSMSIDINGYMKYVEIVRKKWKEIWNFCCRTEITSLKFNSFVYKNHAISRIAKEIIEELTDENNVYPRHKKYFNKKMFDEDKNKKILIAIGTGNGNMTISNTKNSSPKGPLKKLIKELSRYCTVILVPEYNTSQLCCLCDEFLEDVNVCEYLSEKKKKELTEEEKELVKIKEKYTKDNIKRIHQEKEYINQINEDLGKKKWTQIKKVINKNINELIKGAKEEGYYRTSYRLRRCANKHGEHKRCILWERNVNASLNMIKMLRNLILQGSKGHFLKKKKSKTMKEIKITEEIKNPGECETKGIQTPITRLTSFL